MSQSTWNLPCESSFRSPFSLPLLSSQPLFGLQPRTFLRLKLFPGLLLAPDPLRLGRDSLTEAFFTDLFGQVVPLPPHPVLSRQPGADCILWRWPPQSLPSPRAPYHTPHCCFHHGMSVSSPGSNILLVSYAISDWNNPFLFYFCTFWCMSFCLIYAPWGLVLCLFLDHCCILCGTKKAVGAQ